MQPGVSFPAGVHPPQEAGAVLTGYAATLLARQTRPALMQVRGQCAAAAACSMLSDACVPVGRAWLRWSSRGAAASRALNQLDRPASGCPLRAVPAAAAAAAVLWCICLCCCARGVNTLWQPGAE
jgi:hypothetical protein